jgi:hypothetical protein
MGLASSAPRLVSGTLAGAPVRAAAQRRFLLVKDSTDVTSVYKHGNFVKHADFALAFDKEEKSGGAC